MSRTVLVCQGHTCKSYGSAAVLKAFQSYSIPEVTVVGSGCLAQCGQGPMVLILPEEIWYDQVSPDEVKILVERHLLKGQPVGSMLYRLKHPPEKKNQGEGFNLLRFFQRLVNSSPPKVR